MLYDLHLLTIKPTSMWQMWRKRVENNPALEKGESTGCVGRFIRGRCVCCH